MQEAFFFALYSHPECFKTVAVWNCWISLFPVSCVKVFAQSAAMAQKVFVEKSERGWSNLAASRETPYR